VYRGVLNHRTGVCVKNCLGGLSAVLVYRVFPWLRRLAERLLVVVVYCFPKAFFPHSVVAHNWRVMNRIRGSDVIMPIRWIRCYLNLDIRERLRFCVTGIRSAEEGVEKGGVAKRGLPRMERLLSRSRLKSTSPQLFSISYFLTETPFH
jgi:hypothetical protein